MIKHEEIVMCFMFEVVISKNERMSVLKDEKWLFVVALINERARAVSDASSYVV